MDGLNPRKVASLLFIIGIAVVFTLQFGPGSTGFGATGGMTAPGSVASVNGKEIPLRDFAAAWAQQMSFLRSQGSPVPESLARQFGMHNQVLDRLVNTELLAQAAERHGINPSDEELRKLIHQNADFQKDGQFDFERYQQVLRDFYRKTPQDFETELRRQLAAQKMMDVVRANAVVSDDEVRARYEKEGNQAKLVFARFLPAMYADKVPAPTAAQLTEWKKAHEKEIKEYFEANRFVYQQPERIRARQVLVKLPPEATAEQKKAALEKAQALRKEIEGGKDFAQVARDSSEDPGSKARGGDLGWVERGSWEPALADAAFALKQGEVTQPVETKFGVHLVKVEEKQAAQDKKLEDVQDEIATTLYKQERAKQQAQAEAEKALASVKAGQALKTLFPAEKEQPALLRFETETRPEAVETDSFTAEGEAVPHLGPAPELVKAAFAVGAPQALDSVFPLGEGFVVAQVVERQKPDTEGFDKRKEELRNQARQAKQIELTDSFLKALREQGSVVTNTAAIDSVVGTG
ncbi:SurA N-terminal domain-containing protein [Corallococcus macrosporus]|uniref:Periplasmic chaperone PpiD n=1 Tax=Myxococcus fulvus (strain ATCC BAA-855 / HW-1) TaxID=483219 RepID=F8CEK9_MYXFH|nr:SurA N-terminal domain-containing protein [Corallococcus macrosporus]AEI66080.1 peptidylprolyl cis-trans isomerase [Corallococcus macrosporus]